MAHYLGGRSWLGFPSMKTTRREFLKVSTALAAGVALTASLPGSTDHVHAVPAQNVEAHPMGLWLECDGSEFTSEEFPELSETLGSTRLPDCRARLIYADGGKPVEEATQSPHVRFIIKAREAADDTANLVVPIGTIIASL